MSELGSGTASHLHWYVSVQCVICDEVTGQFLDEPATPLQELALQMELARSHHEEAHGADS